MGGQDPVEVERVHGQGSVDVSIDPELDGLAQHDVGDVDPAVGIAEAGGSLEARGLIYCPMSTKERHEQNDKQRGGGRFGDGCQVEASEAGGSRRRG